ncbi:MAG: DNA-binding response regulator [Firmicutes bacterium HGW-Firmicutes-7]|nr:MAG: DNA-binding response regulator [Firmicutes bacterium HGW-Firmicutes-7]
MSLEKSVLIVDDEIKIVSVIESYLIHNEYTVYKAYNGKEALEVFNKESPSLVILDLMLPDISGEEVCRNIRKISRVPIIMLTAKVLEEDILNGLDLGADDYITKPFSPKQLIARVGVVLRRCTGDRQFLSNVLSFNNNDLVINLLKREVKKNNQVVKVTPNEYNILLTLIKFSEKTFTRDELISIVLGDDFDGFDRTVDTHIKNLRQKIESDPKSPSYILTVFGVGYRFDAKP